MSRERTGERGFHKNVTPLPGPLLGFAEERE
jgi:hypothetical protein